MAYVDGFVLIVPSAKLDAYKKLAQKAAKLWKEHGALEYCECVGDDMEPPMGKPFPKLAKAKEGDLVVFAYITFKSRAHRDKVNKAVMADERVHAMCDMDNMPFDPKRMSYGGFSVLVKV